MSPSRFLVVLPLFTLATPTAVASFEWGSSCEGGSGTFSQPIAHQANVVVGEIPPDRHSVFIRLSSPQDVDVQLIDVATGAEIVAWPNGTLDGATDACTTFHGQEICYSGYNGENGQLGNEWIELRGTTTRTYRMEAFGYQAGQGTVDYTWETTPGCVDEGGSGSFQQFVQQGASTVVGDIPAGKSDVTVSLEADGGRDIDVQLWDGSTKIVAWDPQGNHGLLHGPTQETVTYQGMSITYSGYNGRGGNQGLEDITISSTLTRTLTMKVFGYASGTAQVDYSWGPSGAAPVDDFDPEVVFATFGDAGSGTPAQFAVADALEDVCQQVGCQFVVGLGDNIYEDGVSSVNDSAFNAQFEQPYASLDIPFFQTLGNHDHRGNVDAQVQYTNHSSKWEMPSRYYAFTRSAGGTSVRFAALDTDPIEEGDDQGQRAWLISQLEAASQDWKIVFGHHPWRSYGQHGHANAALDEFYDETLCGRADLLLSGHEHDKQHLLPRCGTHMVISGAAGKLRSVSTGSATKWARSSYGFAIIEIDDNRLRLSFYDDDGNVEYTDELVK